jgi:hypothetical protein
VIIEADDEKEIGSALFRRRPIVAGLVGVVVPGHFRVRGFRAKGERFHLFVAAERGGLSFFDRDLTVAFTAFIDKFAHVLSPRLQLTSMTELNYHARGIKSMCYPPDRKLDYGKAIGLPFFGHISDDILRFW